MTILDVLIIWTLVLAAAIVLSLAVYLSAVAYFLYRAGGSRSSRLPGQDPERPGTVPVRHGPGV